jgi:hypothetical protein
MFGHPLFTGLLGRGKGFSFSGGGLPKKRSDVKNVARKVNFL